MKRTSVFRSVFAAAAFSGAAVLSFFQPGLARAAASPEDSAHTYLKALLQDRAGQLADAFRNYEKVSRQDPDDVFIHETLATVAMRMGRMGRALEEGRKVVSLRPDDPYSYLVLGRVHLSRGEVEEADEAFGQALKLDPSNNEALLYSAHLHSSSNPELAISLYKKFLQNNPHSTEAIFRVAELQQRVGDLRAAEESWRSIIEYEPGNAAAVIALANLYDVLKDTPSALGRYHQARELDPDNPGLLLRLGEMYFRNDRMEEAGECFAAAERLAPDDLTVQFWSALIAEEMKDWPAAALRMGRVARESKDPAVLLRLAYYQSQEGRPRRALSTLKRLRRVDPRNPEYLYYLAMGYEDLGRYRESIRWLERVAAADPGRADVHFRIGVAWDNLKRFDRAEPALKKAVELNPRNPVVLNYLGYTYADRKVRLEEALGLIRRALEMDPDNGAYLDSLGWAYYHLGRLEEARAALSKAVERVEDPVVWMHYGDVLSKAGKSGEAVDAWQEGFFLDPENKDLRARLKATGRDVASGEMARLWLKRAEGNLRQIKSLAGQVTLEGGGPGPFRLSGVFYYAQPQLFRLEILGPLFAPEALLVKNGSGLHWSPPEWGRAVGDQDRWLKAFGDFLSGDVFRSFEGPGVAVKARGRTLVFSGPGGALEIDTARGVVTRLLWRGAPDTFETPVDFRFQDYGQVDGLWIPAKTVCRASRLTFSFFFDLARTRLNPSLNAALFDAAPSSPSGGNAREN